MLAVPAVLIFICGAAERVASNNTELFAPIQPAATRGRGDFGRCGNASPGQATCGLSARLRRKKTWRTVSLLSTVRRSQVTGARACYAFGRAMRSGPMNLHLR